MARWISIFKLLLALAKEIESFIQGCCKDMWIQAAMTLTNVSVYVSSVGFDLELCQVAFCKECAATERLTLDEVDDINKAEVEIVKRKASADMVALLEKLTSEMNSLSSKNRDLATYLLRRLLKIQQKPAPTNDDGNYLEKFLRIFPWLKPIQLLGRGASATVEKVMWLEITVAKRTFYGPEDPNFMQEAKILASLCHPNITSMYGCEMMRRSCSIIMELMDENLYNFMQIRLNGNSDSTPFSILEAVGIMLQVGEGVNYLHNKQIVHRDIKSTNILVKSMTANGNVHVKVTDFGLSKTKKSSTFNGLTFNTGTCRWMAPEIINFVAGSEERSSTSEKKKTHPFKCDVYSFGMVCYEILTGDVPFQDEEAPNQVKKMVMEGLRPNIPEDCPQKLKALIQKFWDQTPSKRPSFDVICMELRYLKCLLMTGFSEGPHLTIEEPLQAATKDMPLQASTNVKPSLTMMQAKDNVQGLPLIVSVNGRQKNNQRVSCYLAWEDEWALFREQHELEMKERFVSLQEISHERKWMGRHRENASGISSRRQSLSEAVDSRVDGAPVLGQSKSKPRRRAKYALKHRVNWDTGFTEENSMHVKVPYSSSLYCPTAALFEEIIQLERVCLRKFVAALIKYERGPGDRARRNASWEEYQRLSLLNPVAAINPEEEVYCGNFHLFCKQKFIIIRNELKWNEEWANQLVMDFLEAMKHIFRAHKLALAIVPVASLFSTRASAQYDVKFMEPLESPSLLQTDSPSPFTQQVEFLVNPGFIVLDRMLKCQVYLAPGDDLDSS